MDLSKTTSAQTVTNECTDNSTDRYLFVKYNNSDEEEEEEDEEEEDWEIGDECERYEILLFPERCQSSSRLSPPLVTPQLTQVASCQLDSDVDDHMAGAEHVVDANVSPTRIALSTIEEFVETTVVLRKDKRNELGISIVGGNDTYLESICVKEVHKDSAAHSDGRLRKGDLILAVNDRSLRDISFRDAVTVLREATSPLRLLILRENAQKLFTTHQCPTKFITVELRKGSIKDKLGLSIMQRTNGRGVFITYVQTNSIAGQHCKSITQGDQILEINGQNVRDSNQKDVSQLLCSLDSAIVLLLGRVPSLTDSIREWSRRKAQIFLRARTSTWSSSIGNCNEKFQTQRPSLPVNKDKIYFPTLSPESETGMGLPPVFIQALNNSMTEAETHLMSRTSSLRSQKRLSIVAEDSKMRESMDSTTDQELDQQITDGDNNKTNELFECHLLPSIQVTEF